MSRSYKKHCGSAICSGADKLWRKQWHSTMRAKERDLLNLQLKYPDDDFCYPVPREVDDLWSAPSDGGSHWMYLNFGHYFFEQTRQCWYPWSPLPERIPSREEAWRDWLVSMVGK
jgi:hypothetical protein